MQRFQAFKYELMPSEEQRGNMLRFAGSCRFVYNKALAMQTANHKAGLNKSILDQGWGEFRQQLEYKMLWSGGLFVPVPPKWTSITCPRSGCRHLSKDNRKTQAQFTCVKCGFSENADLVGAINILRAGHAQLACQVNPEVKGQQQEPPSIAA
jgi:putative transposase